MCAYSPYGLQMTKQVTWANLENTSLVAAIELEDDELEDDQLEDDELDEDLVEDVEVPDDASSLTDPDEDDKKPR